MIMANNLGRQYSLHAEEYEKKALEVLRSGWYILGNEVKEFEKNGLLILELSIVWDWQAVLMLFGLVSEY